jgi:hypothetical protein
MARLCIPVAMPMIMAIKMTVIDRVASPCVAMSSILVRHLPPKPRHNAKSAATSNYLKLNISAVWLSKPRVPSIDMVSTSRQTWTIALRLSLKTRERLRFLFNASQSTCDASTPFVSPTHSATATTTSKTRRSIPSAIYLYIFVNISRPWQ